MKKRILIVDDDDPIRNMLSRLLQLSSMALEVVQAASGPEALEHLQHERFDLVMLDYMMPEMTGLEVLQTIRAREGLSELPVIMLTARSDSSDMIESLERGASYYIQKPFEPTELLKSVERILGVPLQP